MNPRSTFFFSPSHKRLTRLYIKEKNLQLLNKTKQARVHCAGNGHCMRAACHPKLLGSAKAYGAVRLTFWLVRFLFLAGTVFFSYDISARTVFFSHFQPSFNKPNRATTEHFMKNVERILSN